MNQTLLMRNFSKIVIAAAAVGLVAIGFAAGILVPWDHLRMSLRSETQGNAGAEAHAHEDEHAHAGDHIDLSPMARANLGLRTGRVRTSTFVRTLHIPGEVVEVPGRSTTDVPARVAGIVRSVLVSPGQAVRPGDPLAEIELTGEALAKAQTQLLDDLQQLANLEAELERLGPLTEGGSVAAKQRLQVQYDRRRVEAQRQARIQELLVLGLSRAQIDEIITNRELIRTMTVVVPDLAQGRDAAADDRLTSVGDSPAEDQDLWEYTVESITVHPGESVSAEQSLARLARHSQLYVRGHAFERDVPIVAAVKDDQTVSVEFGGGGHGGIDGPVGAVNELEEHGEVIDGLKILYLDNHVDVATQTYSFYIPLANQVLRDSIDDRGRMFRSWRFKPGQRLHVRVPIERHENRIVLPAEAVATDGPSAFVFRLAGRHRVEGTSADGRRLYAEEYEQVPVAIAYRDRDVVVLDKQGTLKVGDVIAMNRGYQLLLALKSAAEGGAGHHHGHAH